MILRTLYNYIPHPHYLTTIIMSNTRGGRVNEQVRAQPAGQNDEQEPELNVWLEAAQGNTPFTPTPAKLLTADTINSFDILHRSPSPSSSLYAIVGDRTSPRPDSPKPDEEWEALEEDEYTQTGQARLDPYLGSKAKYIAANHIRGGLVEDSNKSAGAQRAANSTNMESGDENDDWQQAGHNADAQDLAGIGQGSLTVTVNKPQRENESAQNQFISYLVTTNVSERLSVGDSAQLTLDKTDFKSFQSSTFSVRRRFTDFVFLYKTLLKEYPQCAVPPLPDKHKMEYVRGDRFSPDFTSRRAHSLERFIKRLTLHPVLRRAALLIIFLEGADWNATMRNRPQRGMSASEASSTSVLETWTDSFLNAFSKPHKTDKRFVEVREKADKLDDDLGIVSKTVARVARRESDLESDYAELAVQFQKLAQLEPGVQNELTNFATSIETMGQGWKGVREHTDQNYLGSLKDMEAYCSSLNSLLKTREQKQLDFEGLTEYQSKAVSERDSLASNASMGASGFIRAKIEDVRGVDHEASRRERVRKLEVQIRRLQDEVEGAKKTSEAFDEEVIKEVSDFERIKAVEFRDALGGLADANCAFFKSTIDTWEKFIKDMESEGHHGTS